MLINQSINQFIAQGSTIEHNKKNEYKMIGVMKYIP